VSIVKIRAALEAQLATAAPIVSGTALSAVAVGTNALFTTGSAHGLVTGMQVSLPGYTGGTPALPDMYKVLAQSSTTFFLQNSATGATISVTVAGSSGIVTPNLTAFQNVVFSPVPGVPYQKVYLVPFKPDDQVQGAGYYQEIGLFQVTLVYPNGVGIGAILARAELLRSLFKKGSSFVNGGITVQVAETPELGYLDESDEDQIHLPVKVPYMAQIFY
jgi:hypothetical protein